MSTKTSYFEGFAFLHPFDLEKATCSAGGLLLPGNETVIQGFTCGVLFITRKLM
jgi:hypothetical protein